VWNDVKKGVKVILWCDGLQESNPTTAKSRKRSRRKSYSDSDSDKDIIVTSGRSANKKKKIDKDEQLEKIVNELKELHEQQYTPMQYRIWGEMIIGGLYSSKTEAPNTSVFSRAGGKEPKKKLTQQRWLKLLLNTYHLQLRELCPQESILAPVWLPVQQNRLSIDRNVTDSLVTSVS